MVLRTFNVQTVPTGLRREFMKLTQPQQFVNAELIENKLSSRALLQPPARRSACRLLVESLQRVQWQRAGAHAAHQLRARCDPAARARPLQRHAARDGAPSGDALLSRQLAVAGSARRHAAGCRRPDAARRTPGLNENYGRELLELHTLGVDGGYTQQDVIAVARAFTGWTIFDPNAYGGVPVQSRRCTTARRRSCSGTRFPRGGGERMAWMSSTSWRAIHRPRSSSRRSWRSVSSPTSRRRPSSTAWPPRSRRPTAICAR